LRETNNCANPWAGLGGTSNAAQRGPRIGRFWASKGRDRFGIYEAGDPQFRKKTRVTPATFARLGAPPRSPCHPPNVGSKSIDLARTKQRGRAGGRQIHLIPGHGRCGHNGSQPKQDRRPPNEKTEPRGSEIYLTDKDEGNVSVYARFSWRKGPRSLGANFSTGTPRRTRGGRRASGDFEQKKRPQPAYAPRRGSGGKKPDRPGSPTKR